ncbi:MAG: hypothetical protein FJY75_04090 [Candidatus Eisenbacteria bacterium]|uniref:Uncharacterized protein n=1 Tax=Eiseniibacteriota bacterium TaxID=2212470 RepID=A0A937X9L6_UNCEI|nr:hypothetical protein [Candidatus Eisenbacteria bacterium]
MARGFVWIVLVLAAAGTVTAAEAAGKAGDPSDAGLAAAVERAGGPGDADGAGPAAGAERADNAGGADALSSLENGVFIVHVAQSFQYTTDAPEGGWCHAFDVRYGISRCEDQVVRVDTKEPILWFVVAAWSEPKAWCGAGFGFGEYDKEAFVFTGHGPCFPDQGIELATQGWPGPLGGTAIVTTTERWEGNYVPLYHFTGYAYAPGEIPLSLEPRTFSAGTVDCGIERGTADAVALGGLGLFQDGWPVCPPQARSAATERAGGAAGSTARGDAEEADDGAEAAADEPGAAADEPGAAADEPGAAADEAGAADEPEGVESRPAGGTEPPESSGAPAGLTAPERR